MHGKQLRSWQTQHTHTTVKSYFSSECKTVTTEEIATFILGLNLRGLEDSSQDMFLSHLEPFALQQTLEWSNLGSYTFPKQSSTSMHLKNVALGLLNTRLWRYRGFQSIHQGKHWIPQASRDRPHNLSTHQREWERAQPGPIETTYPAGRSSADHAVVSKARAGLLPNVFSRHTERN